MTIEDIFGENVITGNGVNVTYVINEQGYTVVTISNFTGELSMIQYRVNM
jgi:hypothetical protein